MATNHAGKSSPHLNAGEQEQAAQHAAPQALVIHEVVREEGESELERRPSAVAWSGLSAGLSMGFSFLTLAMIRGLLPDAPWSRLVYGLGYTVGFVITILGKQELFTESTLTAMLPLLVRRDRKTFLSVLRFWITVLVANLIGTALFAALLSIHGLFPEATLHAMSETSKDVISGEVLPGFVKSILSGWLIALMAWLLPSAKSARLFVILLITYVVAVGGFPHIVAGSVEAAYAVFQGPATLQDYAIHFLIPTLCGNTLGGVALVALLNHAPLSPELQGETGQSGGNASPTAGEDKPGAAGRARSRRRVRKPSTATASSATKRQG